MLERTALARNIVLDFAQDRQFVHQTPRATFLLPRKKQRVLIKSFTGYAHLVSFDKVLIYNKKTKSM